MKNICLSTDSDEYIKDAKEKWSPLFLKRSKELSNDKALAIDVWKNALSHLQNIGQEYEFSMYIEPSSPIRNIEWVRENIIKFINSNDDLWMSIKETDTKFRLEKQFMIDNKCNILNIFNNSEENSLRQKSKVTYHKDGVFYIAKNKYIFETNLLFSGYVKGVINKFQSINIDKLEELEYARYLIEKDL